MGDAYDRYKESKARQSSSSSGSGNPRVLGHELGGISGFAANAIGDLGELAGGLTSLLSSSAHDVIGGVREMRGVAPEGGTDYRLDDIAKALVFDPKRSDKPGLGGAWEDMFGVFKEDYGRRYGSVEGLKKGLYEDPLSYLLDALDVVTVGGSGLTKAARGASKASSVSSKLVRAAETGEDLSGVARVVDSIIPGRKEQLIGKRTSLGGEQSFVNQKTGRTSDLYSRPGNSNPIIRAIYDRPRNALLSESTSKLRQKSDSLQDLISTADEGDPVTKWGLEKSRLDGIIKLADEQDAKPLTLGKSEREIEKLTDRFMGEMGVRFVGKRSTITDAHKEIHLTLPRAERKTFLRNLMGFEPMQAAGRRLDFDAVDTTLAQANVADPAVEKLSGLLRPHIDKIRQMELDPTADPLAIEKSKRFMEIVAEPLAARGTDELADAVDKTRIVNFEHEAQVFLEAGGDYATLFDRLYNPLRVKQWIDEGLDSWRDVDPIAIDDLVKEGQLKAPAYFPAYDPIRVRASDHLVKSGTWGAGRKSNPKVFKRTEGRRIERYLHGQKDALVTDPDLAYSLLSAEIAGVEETARYVARIKDAFGRRVTRIDDFNPDAEVVINPDAVALMGRKTLEVKEGVVANMAQGDDLGDAFVKSISDAFTNIDADLQHLLQTRGEIFAVPKVVAERMNEVTKYSLGGKWGKRARIYYDGPMNAWRSSTLYLRPQFYAANFVGNETFLWLQGGTKSVINSTVRRLDRDYVKKVQGVLKELGAEDMVQSGFYSDVSQRATSLGPVMDRRMGRAMAKTQESKTYRTIHKPIDWGKHLNNTFEDAARTESFLTAAELDLARRGVKMTGTRLWRSKKRLEQIMKEGIDNPKLIERWADDMNITMNNYAAQSPFTRKVVRRFAAPFWTFFYHASKTLLKMPFKHPLKSTVLMALQNIQEEYMNEEVGLVPEYLENAAPIGGDDFVNAQSYNPIGAASEGWEQFLGILNPAAKIGLERAQGRDVFTGREFSAPPDKFYRPFGSDEAYEVGTGEPATPLPGILEHAARQSPLYQTGRDFIDGGARYGTGETITNPDGSPKYPIDAVDELLRLLGVPITSMDLDRFQSEELRNRNRAANG